MKPASSALLLRDELIDDPSRTQLARRAGPPDQVRGEILRGELIERVGDVGSAPLTILHAPAGYGKSTTMAQLYRRIRDDGVRTAWLTLGAADNDPARLSASLAAALDLPGGSRSPSALFLDDFEVIHRPGALAIIRTLVDDLPRGCRVILASRIHPALDISKHRARGHLLDISTDDLCFSLNETSTYLKEVRRLRLSDKHVQLLHGKTGGWIVAIWLASVDLERRSDLTEYVEGFSGSTPIIAEFLAEDVLAFQPDDVRKFLISSSILRTLEAPACQALLPDADARTLLETMRKRHLVSSSAERRGNEATYHYQPLFHQFLRDQLQRKYPDRAQWLHGRASRWFEERSRPVLAIDHAIEAQATSRALRLLELHAPGLLEHGQFRRLARWFEALPAHRLRSHPALSAIATWSSLLAHGDCGKQDLPGVCDGAEGSSASTLGYRNTFRPLMLSLRDSHDLALAEARQALTRVPTGCAFADEVLFHVAAYVHWVAGEKSEARRLLDDARHAHGESGFVQVLRDSVEGTIALESGRLSEALGRFKSALKACRSSDGVNGNAWPAILYAAALYERNCLDLASRLAEAYLPAAVEVGLADQVILGHTILARTACSRGDGDRAFQLLIALENAGHRRDLPRMIASARLERARLYLHRADPEAAREELERAGELSARMPSSDKHLIACDLEDPTTGWLRWRIWHGDVADALLAAEQELSRCTAQGRHRRALLLRVLIALALQRSGRPAAAMDVIAGVLRKAGREEFVRVLLDEGEPVMRLLRQFRALHEGTAAVSGDPLLLAHLDTVLDASGASACGGELPTNSDQCIEPLSRRELEVLEAVAQGSSNAGIAAGLGLSESTVRTHLRNVNTKLGARARAEAVAIARRLDILR